MADEQPPAHPLAGLITITADATVTRAEPAPEPEKE